MRLVVVVFVSLLFSFFPHSSKAQTFETVYETVGTGAAATQVPIAVKLKNLPPDMRYVYDSTGTKRLDRDGNYVNYDNGNLVDFENEIRSPGWLRYQKKLK